MMLRLALLLLVACQDSPKAVTDHDGDGVEDKDDCDPWNGAVSADSPEICDGLDNDCDGLSDEDDPDLPVQGYVDADEDGYAGTASRSCDGGLEVESVDCDDAERTVHPGAFEDCDTSADDDCDGATTAIDALHCESWLLDADMDGYGVADAICACAATAPYRTQEGGDCDDNDASVNPGAGTCWMEGAINEDDADGVWYEEPRESDGECVNGVGYRVEGAGDVNGDGLMDVLVGAYSESTLADRAGAAYVILGPASGRHPIGEADATLLNDVEGAQMAYSVAGAGDVDGDGYGDLAFGPVSAGVGAETAARLVFGPVSGVRALDDGDLTLALSTETELTVRGAGDPDEDGLLDLLIGAPSADAHDVDGSGIVYLIPTPTDGDVMIESVAVATVQGLHRSALLGLNLSALGDSNGDGVPDPWVSGRDTEDPDSSEYTVPAAYLFQGPLSGAHTTADADAVLYTSLDTGSLTIDGQGDLNGDGYDDLIVGRSGYFGDLDVYGAVYIKFGPLAGVISSADADAVVVGLPPVESTSDMIWTDNLGWSVASPGDLDHDGTDDVLMTGQGLFDLYYSPISGTLDPEFADVRIGYYTWSEEDLYDMVPGYYNGSASVGAPGDVDGDGTPDLLLGSHAYDRDASWPRDNAARIFSGTPD